MLFLAGFTVLVVLAMVGFALLAGGNVGPFTSNARGLLPIGSQAPDFATETVDGGTFSLDDVGGATMLFFFASWCPHCNHDAPIISDLRSRHEDLQAVMIGIDGRDDAGKVQEFVDRYGIEGPAAYDPSLGTTYRVSGYPTVYVLDGNKNIVAAHSGEAPKEVYEGWAEQALAEGR